MTAALVGGAWQGRLVLKEWTVANILITGGRAPVALELARMFHSAGHTVFAAESVPGTLCAHSRAVHRSYIVPPPRWQTGAFIRSLGEIVRREAIELLVPTCEEIFYVSMGRDELSCRVFAEPLERLRRLHDKWEFARLAEDLGLPVPATMRVSTEADLRTALSRWPALVAKPAYSRFASRTLILPTFARALVALQADQGRPWVAQPFLRGDQICSYSVAHGGRLTTHAACRSDTKLGRGVVE